MKITRKAIILFTATGSLIYAITYALLVERGLPGSVIIEPDSRIPCPASYAVEFGFVFGPAHQADRLIRYKYWNPVAKDLAAEAWTTGRIRRAEPTE